MAERGGVAVLPVVAAGMADGRDALLVTEISGRPLRSLEPREITDDILTDVWKGVVRLGELGIAHGPIDGDTVVIRPDGHPAIGNFGGAKVAATDAAVMTDRAQLLVSTALLVGQERAVWPPRRCWTRMASHGSSRSSNPPCSTAPHAAPCTTPRGSSTRSGTSLRARPGSTPRSSNRSGGSPWAPS